MVAIKKLVIRDKKNQVARLDIESRESRSSLKDVKKEKVVHFSRRCMGAGTCKVNPAVTDIFKFKWCEMLFNQMSNKKKHALRV